MLGIGMTDCWMLGEFADSKQARAVCGFGLFPLTTERRSYCRNRPITLKIPQISVRYVEPASPVRKVEFKLMHENSDRFISNMFAGRSAWLSRFGQWQGDITDIVLMGNAGR